MREVQTLARGLKILDQFVYANHALSVTELASDLDIDKSTVSRLVKTLVSYGYLQAETGTRRYVLGKQAHMIGWQLYNRIPVREKAHPYLKQLARQTGECAHTAVYLGSKALVIDDVEADVSMLRVVGERGRMIPMHCTAVGKALLAFADIPLPDELVRWTANTIVTTGQLAKHLQDIRAQGYALDDEEYEHGIRCMAAPVYNFMGVTIATIGISGPTVRLTRERIPELAAVVMAAAKTLSTELNTLDT